MKCKQVSLVLLTLSFALFLFPVHPDKAAASDEDSRRVEKGCTAVGSEEVKEILKKIGVPEVRVLSIAESPMKGFCEIVYENGGQLGVFYLEQGKEFLIVGSLVEIANAENKTQESIAALQEKSKVDIKKIPLDNALVLGESGAEKKVIVFTDPDCPFCGELHKTMKHIIEERKDVGVYIKFLPLKMHKDAYWKAKSIVCNKSLQMLEDSFAGKIISRLDCATNEIDESMKLAASINISITPSIILPDGSIATGALEEECLINLIDGKK